jgi:hypothetical protein
MFDKISIAAIATAIFSSAPPAPTTLSVKVDYDVTGKKGTLIVIGNRDTVLEAAANQLGKLTATTQGTPHRVAKIYDREVKRGSAIAECTIAFSGSATTVSCFPLPSSPELKAATATRPLRSRDM